MSRMLFSGLYKIMVNKVNFVGFGGAIDPLLNPPCVHLCSMRSEISHDTGTKILAFNQAQGRTQGGWDWG